MNIDVNNIISAGELVIDTDKVNEKLAEKPELIIFDNNRPQFVILSLERFEQFSDTEKKPVHPPKPDVKIGKLVQDTFLRMIDKDILPKSEIDKLCNLEY